MQNEDFVENGLENKNYSFSFFCTKNSFVSKDASLKLMLQILRSLKTMQGRLRGKRLQSSHNVVLMMINI